MLVPVPLGEMSFGKISVQLSLSIPGLDWIWYISPALDGQEILWRPGVVAGAIVARKGGV